MIAPKIYTGVLKQKVLLANETYDFIIETAQDIPFEAGQFMNVTIKDGSEPVIRRAYSICSPPFKKRELTLCIKIVAGGRATTWFESLKEGAEIEFMAPLGHFTFKKDSPNPALFIATGTGVAPLKAMIEEQLFNQDKRPMTLLFGLRHMANMFYQKEFEEMAATGSNFKQIYTLSRPEDGSWQGETGRVTDWLNKNFEQNFKKNEVDVYICGLGDMVEEVQKLLMEKGVPKEQIYFERYS